MPTNNFNKIGSNLYSRKTTFKNEYMMFISSNHFSEKIINLLNFFNELNFDSINPLSKDIFNKIKTNESNLVLNTAYKNELFTNINDTYPNSNQIEDLNKNNNIIIKLEYGKFLIRKNTNETIDEYECGQIIKKERSKLIYISKIYQTFLDLNYSNDNVFNEFSKTVLDNPINYNIDSIEKLKTNIKKKKKGYYFRLDSLKVKDLKLQIAICTIFGLYLIQVINKNICYVLLKFICNKFKLTQNDIYCIQNLKEILCLKTEILLGVYYSLYENLKSLHEFHPKTNMKNNNLLKITNSTYNIQQAVLNDGSSDVFIEKSNINVSVPNQKNTIDNIIITSDNELKEEKKDEENSIFSNKKEYKKSKNNPNLKWEKIIEVLDLEFLIFNITKITQRNSDIYDLIENTKIEDRKKFLLYNIIKPLDELYNLFDEALILVQYLSDFIKVNNFHDILLAEFTKDYRYFLETKDVFFQYLNSKSKNNLIFHNLTDRIFSKHKQNYLGNSLFFKLKEKKIQEKLAEHENNLSLKKYFHDVSTENMNKTKNLSKTMTNLIKSIYDKNFENKTSFETANINSRITNQENNLKKFNKINKSKQNSKKKSFNSPKNYISKKHFYSQFIKNEQIKENIENIKKEEEKINQMEKRICVKDKDIKSLITFFDREKNNRNDVEKEQIIIRNIRSKYSDSVKSVDNYEKNNINNEIVYSKSYDKMSDIHQNSIIREKNLNNSINKSQYYQNTQVNDIKINNFNTYKSSNFLLTQVANDEKNLKISFNNMFENNYKLIPKKEFNRKHNYFFENELYKVKMTKNINNYQKTSKIANGLEEEISDYFKTIKLNIGNKPLSSNNNYKRTNNLANNVNSINNSNIINADENMNKVTNKFNRTTQNFHPNRTNYKSIDIIKNIYESPLKNQIDDLGLNIKVNRNSENKDQLCQINQQEFLLSRPDSPEKYRKSSNNFLYNNIKIMTNEDMIRLNNFRIISPKANINDYLHNKNKNIYGMGTKNLKIIGDNLDMINANYNDSNQSGSKKITSNFINRNSNYKNFNDNLKNFNKFQKQQTKKEKQHDSRDLLRNSQNNFFINPNKIVIERKQLRSYNPKTIKNGLVKLSKEEKISNNYMGVLNESKEETKKKKIVI